MHWIVWPAQAFISTAMMGVLVRRSSPSSLWVAALAVWAFSLSCDVLASNDTTALVCQGVGDALYKTDWEREQNPCDVCQYDASSRNLKVECRYEYCEECDKDLGFCGVRVIQIDHDLTQEAFEAFLEQRATLDLGSTRKYCIDYSDGGAFAGKLICVDIDDSFNTNCDAQYEDLAFGLPLLTCDKTVGCQCAVSNGNSDTTSPFIAYEKLEFDSCYVEGQTTSSARTFCFMSAATILVSAIAFVLR